MARPTVAFLGPVASYTHQVSGKCAVWNLFCDFLMRAIWLAVCGWRLMSTLCCLLTSQAAKLYFDDAHDLLPVSTIKGIPFSLSLSFSLSLFLSLSLSLSLSLDTNR